MLLKPCVMGMWPGRAFDRDVPEAPPLGLAKVFNPHRGVFAGKCPREEAWN